MGLFDFFRKKPVQVENPTPRHTEELPQQPHSQEGTPAAEEPSQPPTDLHQYVLHQLSERLAEMELAFQLHPQYMALVLPNGLEIAAGVADIADHGTVQVLHLLVMTIHTTYFPKGIETHLAGFGSTAYEAIDSAVDNYITTILPPILDGFSDSHSQELDFLTETEGREILWHPKLGRMSYQGQWPAYGAENEFFETLKDILSQKLLDRKFNWVKIYLARQMDGSLMGECIVNNEHWMEGFMRLKTQARTWPTGSFLGQKQFWMIRRCDAYDSDGSRA